ncbi:hypothetical protein GH714_023470 [Hevea brasiliensis]|uniref:Uncharacterized protein n=1 Tax=Hevea brasiliensis TaxID=3981 RepID=A0A6A6KU21_HEVBR|nr:hypothetical protein GH714_023470 [Hevea brasiliensis]
MVHGTSSSITNHKRQTINCYTGCPSASELSSLWSFILDFPSVGEATCEQELGLMSIIENSSSRAWGPENTTNQNASGTVTVDEADIAKSGVYGGTSSVPELISMPNNPEQPVGSVNAPLLKLCCPGTKGPALCEDDDLYKDFNMDEVDLNLENYEELFGVTLNNSEELLRMVELRACLGQRTCPQPIPTVRVQWLLSCLWDIGSIGIYEFILKMLMVRFLQGSSVGLVNAMQPACSNAASADSMMSTKTEPILCFTTRQGHSSLSFSGLTGESSVGDYQDCGASSMLFMGEPPWCPPCPESSCPSSNRSNAVMRYKEKKKTRM